MKVKTMPEAKYTTLQCRKDTRDELALLALNVGHGRGRIISFDELLRRLMKTANVGDLVVVELEEKEKVAA